MRVWDKKANTVDGCIPSIATKCQRHPAGFLRMSAEPKQSDSAAIIILYYYHSIIIYDIHTYHKNAPWAARRTVRFIK